MIGCTITGADDAVDPGELAALSDEFPFVEWGILVSPKRAGTPRYPSAEWTGRFAKLAVHGMFQAAQHICGAALRTTVDGGESHLRSYAHRFQLNGYQSPMPYPLQLLIEEWWDRDFVLQARSAEAVAACVRDAREANGGLLRERLHVLIDCSGGRGVTLAQPDVEAFAAIDTSGVIVGLAGGIGPDNIVMAIETANRLGCSWIDMESGVRTDDHFDLAKVRAVLEAVKGVCG